jgi:hypothetical protein
MATTTDMDRVLQVIEEVARHMIEASPDLNITEYKARIAVFFALFDLGVEEEIERRKGLDLALVGALRPEEREHEAESPELVHRLRHEHADWLEKIYAPGLDARTPEQVEAHLAKQLSALVQIDAAAAANGAGARRQRDALLRFREDTARRSGANVADLPATYHAIVTGIPTSRLNVAIRSELEATTLLSSLLHPWKVKNAVPIASRAALSKAKKKGLSVDAVAERRLREALEKQILRAQRLGCWPTSPELPDEAGESDSVRFLEGLGDRGTLLWRGARAAAAEMRDRNCNWQMTRAARPPGTLVDEDPPWRDVLRLPRWVADVLLQAEILPRLERDRQLPPGLALPIAEELARMYWAPDTRLVMLSDAESGSRSAELRNRRGDLLAVASFSAEDVDALQRGILLLRSYMGHVMIRRLIDEGWRRTRDEISNPSVIGFEGGLTALVEWLDAASHRARDEVQVILRLGQMFHVHWSGGEFGGLWTYFLNRAAPGRPAYLELRLSRPLMPYFGKQNLRKGDQHIVPMPPMPPRVGRPNEWGAQASLQFKIVRELVARRVELVRDGGALLSRDQLARLAASAGVPIHTLDRVLDRWTHDGGDGEACLEIVGRDRYHLPKNGTYAHARAFIERGGEITLNRRKAAEASVQARHCGRRARRKG